MFLIFTRDSARFHGLGVGWGWAGRASPSYSSAPAPLTLAAELAHHNLARIVSSASPRQVHALDTALTTAFSSSSEDLGSRNRCAASSSLSALARWYLACSMER